MSQAQSSSAVKAGERPVVKMPALKDRFLRIFWPSTIQHPLALASLARSSATPHRQDGAQAGALTISSAGKQLADRRRGVSRRFRRPAAFSKPRRSKQQQPSVKNVVVVHAAGCDAPKIEIALPSVEDGDDGDWESDEELAFLPDSPAEGSAGSNDEGSSSGSDKGKGKEVATNGAWTTQPVFEEEEEGEEEEGEEERKSPPAGMWKDVPVSFLTQDAYTLPKYLRRVRRNPHRVPRRGEWKSRFIPLNTIQEVEGM